MHIDAHLVVPDADEAAGWYVKAFGARELSRIPLPGNRVMTVELALGDSVVHVGSEFPEMGIRSPLAIGDTATVLQINTDDADAAWALAVNAGAVARHELADTFWGERHGQLTDPFGHRWNRPTAPRRASRRDRRRRRAGLRGRLSARFSRSR
jgi:PhnB protein